MKNSSIILTAILAVILYSCGEDKTSNSQSTNTVVTSGAGGTMQIAESGSGGTQETQQIIPIDASIGDGTMPPPTQQPTPPINETTGTDSGVVGIDSSGPLPAVDAEVDAEVVDTPSSCENPVNEEACDTTKRPIVFVHGTVGSGDNLAGPFQLFASNGYCSSYLKAVDYNSLGGNPVAELDEVIAQLQQETGFDKVDIAGHSQGTAHASAYVGSNPDKINRYLHQSGMPVADPGGVPTLCLSSVGDPLGQDCPASAGSYRSQDMNVDHFAVASSIETFIEMYKFLNDGELPEFTEVQCEDNIVLEGRAITFPDSQFVVGGKIEVYEVGDDPRQREAPIHTFDIPADGKIGPWNAQRDVQYEFKMIAPDSRQTRYAYMPPFKRSDRWIRFLYKTTDDALASTSNSVNRDDNHAVMVVRMKRGGFHFGRDSLTIDGFEAINADNAPQGTATVGMYLFDAAGAGAGQSDGGSVITGPFINSSDVFIPATTPAFVIVNFNGQELKIPNWPSGTEGMSLVLFD